MSNIVLKNLSFSNMFSYGANNSIRLNANPITQLTAINGSGKSSIAIILQEILYNKNIKSIKKGDIANRYIGTDAWNGKLEFSINEQDYIVSVNRKGATTKVQLLRGTEDISEHKVLDTYKKIQELLALDFDIFSQITYQSSTDLLDFLKATDTNRKKFLINLFNLEKYVDIGEKIKVKASEVDKELIKLSGELKSIDDFLNSTTIPDIKVEKLVPIFNEEAVKLLGDLEKELANYKETCKKIDKNNLLKSELATIKLDSVQPPVEFTEAERYNALKHDLTVLLNDIQRLEQTLKSTKILDTCPACGQAIDSSHLIKMKEETTELINDKKNIYNNNLSVAKDLSDKLNTYQAGRKAYELYIQDTQRVEHLMQLIDNSLANNYPDTNMINKKVDAVRYDIAKNNSEIKEANEWNKQVSAHNAKIDGLIEQKADFTIRQSAIKQYILNKSSQSNALSILKKAFSTTGIVAFKLENLTKELETTINYYLSLLSDGQFQVEFVLDKEKLNINVISDGETAPIETVSGGEFSRIQTSILLAIRKLLASLGGSSINLLFLDEITGVLDAEGKEKLIEVLSLEEDLNVFLISHDFEHPLIDKIYIVKEEKISRIVI